jgi:hypothetical protein
MFAPLTNAYNLHAMESLTNLPTTDLYYYYNDAASTANASQLDAIDFYALYWK